MLVLLDHGADQIVGAVYGTPLRASDYWFARSALGAFGVHIFFSLSGYLITRRLIAEDGRQGVVSLKNFYIRRVFRIQPAAITYLLVIGALAAYGTLPVNSSGWASALLGYANFNTAAQTWFTGHFWSLAVEEHFYLLWPAVFVLLGARRRLAGAILIAAGIAVWRTLAIKYQLTQSANFNVRTDIESDWLMWGCIAALSGTSQRAQMMVQSLARPGISLIALPLTVCAALPWTMDWKFRQALMTLAAMTAPLMFVGSVSRANGALGTFLEWPVMSWVGRISFSLYLWQQLFVVFDDQRVRTMGILQSSPFSFFCAIAAAAASYYWIERPFIDRGRLLVSRLRVRREGDVRTSS